MGIPSWHKVDLGNKIVEWKHKVDLDNESLAVEACKKLVNSSNIYYCRKTKWT